VKLNPPVSPETQTGRPWSEAASSDLSDRAGSSLPGTGESDRLPSLPKADTARGATVCLCATHPLALAEFEQSLADRRFRVHTRRLEPDGSSARSAALPRASAYVLDLPSQRHAAETIVSRILHLAPHGRIVVVGEKFDDATAFALLRSGVRGLIRYNEARENLGRALDTLKAGGYWVPRSLLSRFVEHTLGGSSRARRTHDGVELSGREREVLGLIHENFSNKEIASRLHISPRTAKFHVSNLLAKHGVKRRAELILIRFAQGQHG
jgi:DNA-binding NarL/FixJ family response regulator